jgi:hypothetical protein
MTVYDEVRAERAAQEARWGNEFDDKNTPYNWAAYLGQYATRSLIGDPMQVARDKFRADMVKVAALAVAAIEAHDRAS